MPSGEVLHTGCVAFGMDRLAVALFVTHGAKINAWPAACGSAGSSGLSKHVMWMAGSSRP